MVFQIIKHAFSMIFNNLGQALRVSVGPYLLLVVAAIMMISSVGLTGFLQMSSSGQVDPRTLESLGPIAFLVIFGLIIGGLFVFGWVAVAWHRFILLEEYSGMLPQISDRPIWPYIGRSMLYGLLIALLALPLLFIFGLFAAPFISSPPSIIAVLIFIIPEAIMALVWFRIALALPAVAVGKPITMGEAWSASSGFSGTIFGVAALLMLINGAAELIIGQITLTSPIIAMIFNIGVQWLLLMLGVSILTTFYGHLIEKRPLIN